ncbi:hypothetical protein L288_14495 [Sphingobium quisquiliarum P25]|uniref:HTH lysR-type domain-containing protein n=1 Tax=Sphingobium quisquiliarum P25 TaxID=1329909 RepID=T0HWX2_9SPHN|nr:LysR substrate-binding domain-containing protein [Sphingobium quisquiliarum]EQB03805.1 hypothetical protein L288_14495 [Sphingobium quisquiliarum P25]
MDIRRLDLNLLLLLDRLYDSRSLTAAAYALGIRQPLASSRLAELRRYFGDELFVRTGRGMRPTPFTERIITPLREAMAIIEGKVIRKPGYDAANSDREFTLTTSDIGALVFLPPLLDALAQVAPRITLRCLSLPQNQVHAALERGMIDLAIGYFPDVRGPNIGCAPLFEHPFSCIVRDSNQIVGTSLDLDAFLAAEHLVVDQEGSSQAIVERRVADLGLARRVRLHVPNFLSVPHLISRTDMISVVPSSLGVAYARIYPLRVLPPPFPIPAIPLGFFWHRRTEGDPEVGWLREFVRSELTGRDPTAIMTEA